MAKLIKIDIDQGTGEFTVDLTGFQGKGCDDIIKGFASLGTMTKEVHKPEWIQQTQNTVKAGK